jgi:putative tricarboxylic transport membrane protein
METYVIALQQVFTINNIIAMFIGTFFGILIGALPGLSVTVAVTLLLPFTLVYQGISGILMILGSYCGAIYGGSISAILLNTPGTPGSAATCIDGHPMAARGEPGRALGISTASSVFGGIFSCLCLMFGAPLLSRIAIKFGPPEFFALAIFGISIITGVSGKSVAKGLIGGLLGLLISTIGLDPMTNRLRFTFGTIYLLGGLSYVPALIGLYAFSQALIMLEESYGKPDIKEIQKLKHILPTWADLKRVFPTMLRSSIIGTFIGAVPGTGGDIACFLSYSEAKRWSKHKDEFGKGAPEGIAAPEAGNNAVSGGALVPMLTLNIPGDGCVAIIMGAFLVQGLIPGPMLFIEHREMVYAIFMGLFVVNIVMGLLGFSCLRFFAQVLKIPMKVLTPFVFVFSFVGAFCINNSFIDMFVMLFFGILGFIFLKLEFTLAPILLGILLGRIAESNLRLTLLTFRGDLTVFLRRPIALAFIIIAVLTLCSPIFGGFIKRLKNKKNLLNGSQSF